MDTLFDRLSTARLSRRTMIKALGAGGAAMVAPAAALLPHAAEAAIQSPLLCASTEIGVVSRSTNKLDIFATDAYGNIVTAAWEPDFTDGWHGWWGIQGGITWPGSPVTAVCRNTDQLDIFVVGSDRGVWTASWNPTSGWQGWWRIGSIQVPPGSRVGAVSRSTDKLDIFVTDVNGAIQTAAWEPDFTDGWHGWWPINGGEAQPGAPVGVVSRSTDKLDIFVVGTDGYIWTAAWEPDFSDGWHGWSPINGAVAVKAVQGAPVTAASRSTDVLNVLVVATDGQVYTIDWTSTSGWVGWTLVGGNITVPQGAQVNAGSRAIGHLEAFVTDAGGVVRTSTRGSFGAWSSWTPLAGGSAAAGAPVTVARRDWGDLDAFVVPGDYRTWTAGFSQAAGGGWQGWWPVGNPATPPPSLSWHGDITFADGTTVGGSWDLLLHPDGSFEFSGSLRDSGFWSYDAAVGVVLLTARMQPLAFGDHGHMDGTDALNPNRDWNFDDRGSHQAVAASYVDLVGTRTAQWQASVSVDLGAVIADIVAAYTGVKTVIDILS